MLRTDISRPVRAVVEGTIGLRDLSVLNVGEIDQDCCEIFGALKLVVHESAIPQFDDTVCIGRGKSARDEIRSFKTFLLALRDKRR